MTAVAPTEYVKTPVDAPFSPIEEYYRETIEDYQVWSPAGYMHFGIWDWDLNPFIRAPMLERMNDYLFGLLKLEELEPSRIGDFGCGLGAVTKYGAHSYSQHHWVGLTISREQVVWNIEQLADESCRQTDADNESPIRFQNDNWEIWWADYHQTPFEDESLGSVFFLESICHSSNLERVLDEAYRVLQPGRRVVIVDGLMKKSESQLPQHVRWLMQETCRNWAVPRFHSLQDLLSQADQSGFKIVETKDIAWSIVPSVLHSPFLIAWRALVLAFRKLIVRNSRPTVWQWRHLRACWLGMFLGFHRSCFGYYSIVLEK